MRSLRQQSSCGILPQFRGWYAAGCRIYFYFALLACASLAADWNPAPVPAREPTPSPGPVWLRCFIRVPDNMVTPAEKDLWRDSVMITLGAIRGPFVVFVNGREIASGEAIPSGERRRFKVPKGILEKKKFNSLAIRLEGEAAREGLVEAPIFAGYFDEQRLEGTWERFDGEPDSSTIAALSEQPATAAFTEAGFRLATTPLAATEPMRGARLAPADSLAKMETAADFRVELILSEPQVAQPTHISFDERGRMWVAQYRQYPYPAGLKMISRDKFYRSKFDRVPPPPPQHDRGRDMISVHEDTDNDGVFEKSKVVLDGLNMANAVLRGHGGLWVMHTPYLLFYPDANGDDVPDGDPEVRLGGFGLEDTHSVANGLAWGPDGWLYGAQGSTVRSRVVRPGIDPAGFAGVYHEGCMVWRYHPRTKAYEIFAEGGGNVFGLEFDSEGRLFSGHNGGDTRGWHYVQGGFFVKQGFDPGKYGPSGHAFAFGNLAEMKSRNPIPRFSHATIVAEGTALPAHSLGRFFAADPLHRKIIIAERYPRGSTFETSDSGVALAGGDPSFRPVYLTNAPDGSIYVADFYEEFIAHGQNYQGQIDPDTGRIFRLRGRDSALEKDVSLAAKTSEQLIKLLAHPNRWHRHTAVRLLGERRDAATAAPLRDLLEETAVHPALEALWTLHQIDALDEAATSAALKHPASAVRAWAVRLEGRAAARPPRPTNSADDRRAAARPSITRLESWLRIAAEEADPEVRSQLAASARRLPAKQALELIAALLHRGEDAADPYIPLLCWWAIEPHCAHDRDAVIAAIPWDAALAKQHILPRLMRRFAASGKRTDLLTCGRLLDAAPSAEHRRLLMTGFEEAFKGRALPPLPDELLDALARSGVASPHLRVRLREPAAIAHALKVATDPKAKLDERMLCVRLFGEVKVGDAQPALIQIATSEKSAELRKAALTSLLLYEDLSIGEKIATAYTQLPAEAQPAAQTLLTSRAAWSLAFLRLIESSTIPRAQLPPDVAERLRAHNDASVSDAANRLFAKPAETPASGHRAEIDRVRQAIAAGAGDAYKGEPIFQQRCSACHTLFHKGGRIGPDLTSYQRDDLGTLLPSIIDPNAEIREGFRNHVVSTRDGRTLSGIITADEGAVMILRGFDGQDVSLPRAEVREVRATERSLMPEGLLSGLSDQELRDFFAYLRISQPITR